MQKNEETKYKKIPVEVTNVYRRHQKAKTKIVIHSGGAGSSKSWSLAQIILFEYLLKYKNLEIIILRKTRQSLKLSLYKDFIKLLRLYEIYNEENHNKTDLIYTVPETGSYVLFAGLDQRERIKSTQWHTIWLEEANEFEKEDFTFLHTRLYRGEIQKGIIPQIWMSFNPVDCWIFELEGKKDVTFIRSNYKDNPFLNEQYIETLEGLKDEDEIYYKIYTLGERAIPTGVIYKPYVMLNVFPEYFDEVIYGLDFAFNSPTGFLEIGIKDEKECYLTEKIYQTKLNNPDRIELLKEIIPNEHRARAIYADCEDPADISEIYDAGFNIKPCVKGKGSVKDGILFCKRFKYYSNSNNVNLNKERQFYKWKVDKNGHQLDEPVKFRDHLMDAKRYAIYTHFKDSGIIADIKKAKQEIDQGVDAIAVGANW